MKPFVLQNYCLYSVHQGINRHFSTPKKLLDSQTMQLLPWNANLMDQTREEMNNGPIPLEIQIAFPFPSKQL